MRALVDFCCFDAMVMFPRCLASEIRFVVLRFFAGPLPGSGPRIGQFADECTVRRRMVGRAAGWFFAVRDLLMPSSVIVVPAPVWSSARFAQSPVWMCPVPPYWCHGGGMRSIGHDVWVVAGPNIC